MGTKSTWVPYFFHAIEMVPKLCGSGIGISPPELNEAARPLTVTSVGSDRIFIRLSCRNASSTP